MSGKKRLCPAHDKEHWARVHAEDNRPSAKERGYDKDWSGLRRNYLRTRPMCERCGEGRATIVHHIVEVQDAPELRLEWSNLQAVCRECHEKAHGFDRRKR